MDQIDEKILELLRKNGRISMQKLAKKLPMSVPATYDRVKKLEDSGIITGYTITVDTTKMGKTVNAFILCSLRIGELESNIRWAKKTSQIIAAYTIAGRYPLLLRVACTDVAEYHELINTLYTCSLIEPCIIIKEVKNSMNSENETPNS